MFNSPAGVAVRSFLPLVIAVTVLLVPHATTYAQTDESRGWRVWVRQEPCSGRFDWLTVAKEHQGGGKNIYVPYETVMGNQGCSQSGPRGCTFQEATDLMESLRGNEKFFSYCCRSYSVWENAADRERSVVLGYASPGTGWTQVKSNLCCEEAEDLAGKPGACSGLIGSGNGSTGKAASGANFGANWTVSNEYGPISLKLKQAEGRVTGSMSNTYGTGTVEGTVSGRSLKFTWKMLGESGTGEAVLASDGKSFSGTWTTSGQTFPLSGTKVD